MLSSGSLRARIVSVVDALSAAAAAQIASVVEEDMVLLRLEVRRREDDIRQLKSSIELLHGELRAAQQKDGTQRPETQSDAGDGWSLSGQVRADDDHSFLPVPELQVKSEPVEEGGGPPDCAAYEAGRWTATTQNQIDCSSSDYVPLGQNLPGLAGSSVDGGSSLGRGLLGYSQYRNLYSTVRRRTVKRLMFKKGFICPYCGKCFERAGHLERHKRIHTGEKPYRCEICGRRFNQNCSLKEHTKIHRRCLKSSLAEIQAEEEKHLPEVSLCEDMKNQEGRLKNDDSLSTPVQVKPEPAEEDAADENIGGFERDSQLWMSRLQKTSQQSIPSFPETDPLVRPPPPSPPPPLPPLPPAPSYCSFSFPGKPYSQLKNSLISQTAFGPSDALMMSSDAASEGVAEASISPHPHRRSRSFQVIRPKKSFVCSYCGKIFERAGHLERHLRIHTGEKPYGCHICGRCFNQKSSLKGHMRTHRDGENSDLLEAPHLMFTLPDHHLLENLVEPENSLSAAEEPVSGGGGAVVVKLEPNGDDFPTESPGGPHGTDWRQLWTCGGQTSAETSEKTVCVLLQDVKYHDHPGRSDQPGYSPPIRTLPFVQQKELMPSQQFCVLGGPTTSDRRLVSEPQDPLRTPEEDVSDGTQEGGGFEYNMEDACSRQNSFICSSCGQNFDHFHLFQRHQCESTSL